MCAHPRASATRRSTSSAQPAAHLFGAWRGTCYSAWWMKFDSCTAARSAHNAPQSVHSRWPHASAQKIDTTSTAPASLLSRAPHVRAMAPFRAERSNCSKSIAERALESNLRFSIHSIRFDSDSDLITDQSDSRLQQTADSRLQQHAAFLFITIMTRS